MGKGFKEMNECFSSNCVCLLDQGRTYVIGILVPYTRAAVHKSSIIVKLVVVSD